MSFKHVVFATCLLLLISGCKSNQNLFQVNGSDSKQIYQHIAHKKYGEHVEFIPNANWTYMLCQKEKSDHQPIPNQVLEFFVYDIKNQEIIYENKMANVKVDWYNNTQLMITNQRGYITGPTDTGKWTYIFDLMIRKKVSPGIRH